ncbi:MAG: hypothetical protein K5771_07630 [Oscillospiraceae bacterium]|nr:hypothetical protein [Oscillospiraceae bacterium]
MKNKYDKIIVCMVLIVFALVSFFPVSEWASSLGRNKAIMDSLDQKAQTVLRLTASSTLASAAISAIPGDTATPIADKLADFSGYFMLILCVLYAEKYLLSLVALGVCKIMIPVACLLGIILVIRKNEALLRLTVKIVLVALALSVTIPFSVKVSDMIDARYNEVVATTVEESESFSESIRDVFNGGESISQKASRVLNRYVESAAVMIVTSCLIPLIVLLFFIWLIKTLTGIDLAEKLSRRLRKPQLSEPEERS